MKSYLNSTLFLVLILSFSCGKKDDPSPSPPTAADIIGSVSLYDEGTTSIDDNGMEVSIEGTAISASTDEEGEFTLSDVPFGTYTIVYEKEGFGTFKRFQLAHEEPESSTIITDVPSLGQRSSTQITSLSATVTGSNAVISFTTEPSANNSNTRYARYFLSTSSNVSSENYDSFSQGFTVQISPIEVTLSAGDLADMGFSSGETVYVKVYGDSFWSNQYEDPDLDRTIFPNLNTVSADAVSFTVP